MATTSSHRRPSDAKGKRRKAAINVTLTLEQLEVLDELAAQAGCSRSALIRAMVAEGLRQGLTTEDQEDAAKPKTRTAYKWCRGSVPEDLDDAELVEVMRQCLAAIKAGRRKTIPWEDANGGWGSDLLH